MTDSIHDEIPENSFNINDKDHIQVYLRLKNCNDYFEDLYEIRDSKTIVTKVPEGYKITRNVKNDEIAKKFTFSKIFGVQTTQAQIFNELVKPKILKCINGHNSSLLTYGASSSGKTYTIIGTAEEPGVIPRSLEYLFCNLPVLNRLPTVKPLPYGKVVKLTEKHLERESLLKERIFKFNLPKNSRNAHLNTCKDQPQLLEDCSKSEISVWISFAEIYNENIYDLLKSTVDSKKEKLKLGWANGVTYVKNLNLVHVTSEIEAYQVLQYGLHHLNYAKTNLNYHSSRSHSIFTIWMTHGGVNRTKDSCTSYFHFCDLAGAERSKKTLNVGDRLKESNNINTSLLVLGRCMAAVRKIQQSIDRHIVPFRESKLTQLFQKALSGYEDISIIVTLNPCRDQFDESQHVLNFSAIAQEIVTAPIRNEHLTTSSKPTAVLQTEIFETLNFLNSEKNESSSTSCETICVFTSDEKTSASDVTETDSSSSDEEDPSIGEWRKKVKFQDTLIAEHHKTISSLKKQIESLKSRYDEDMKQLKFRKDKQIQELARKMQEMKRDMIFDFQTFTIKK